ncbi:biopolymer transporter ExbD [Cognatiyoonia sp. IB215446]|uniref:ExbD/TolR family protein n=1 Tax=Cognatiyoonia sp. IB215446 TaxID=3097355 RepID=UPI002A148EB7|nr:biopolymer transporter ExbD [Cognatiyoonia sp. IB215446]MDX8350494.1 biopolymer transporter ExbD [Cognatiyoonia sp. IB215446]
MRQITRKKKAEPTIALINIVFLMLIFFLVAGTLAQPLEGDLELVETQALEGREPPDALVIKADGGLSHRGAPLPDVAAFLQDKTDDDLVEVRIVPDRALSADRLVTVSRNLREGGAQSVIIVTERALQ